MVPVSLAGGDGQIQSSPTPPPKTLHAWHGSAQDGATLKKKIKKKKKGSQTKAAFFLPNNSVIHASPAITRCPGTTKTTLFLFFLFFFLPPSLLGNMSADGDCKISLPAGLADGLRQHRRSGSTFALDPRPCSRGPRHHLIHNAGRLRSCGENGPENTI